MEKVQLQLSSLRKTWIFDLDGTLMIHNGYKDLGHDVVIEEAVRFIESIDKDDLIIFITSRKEEERENTIDFLRSNNIRFDQIIFDAPYGERIVINDKKPSGLNMAYAVNINRNEFPELIYTEDL